MPTPDLTVTPVPSPTSKPPVAGAAPKAAQPPLIPAPTASLTASPATVDAGRTSTLTWTTLNAPAVSIDNGIGAVAANDSLPVTPLETTTYTLTAVGPGGVQQTFVTVTTNPPPKPLYVVRVLPPDLTAATATFAKALFDGYPKLVSTYVTAAPSGVTTVFAVFSA